MLSKPVKEVQDLRTRPPRMVASTLESIKKEVLEWGKENCSPMNVAHTSKNQVSFVCARGTLKKEKVKVPVACGIVQGKKKRKVRTTKCGCEFTVYATRITSESNPNHGKWIVTNGQKLKKTGRYDHSCPYLPDDVHVLAACRGLTPEQEERRAHLYELRCFSSKQILTLLIDQFGEDKVNVEEKDIENLNEKQRQERLQGMSTTAALIRKLPNLGYVHAKKIESGTNALTHLIFAHKGSIKLAQLYSNIFALDCTYKTMLNIVEIDCHNKTFNVASAFLLNEQEESYKWALEQFKDMLGEKIQPQIFLTDNENALINAQKVVFPNTRNHQCRWHITKNVKIHIGKCMKGEHLKGMGDTCLADWCALYNCESEELFQVAWDAFKSKYVGVCPQIVEYLDKQWVCIRHTFLSCHVLKHMTLLQVATSRAEASHCLMKKQLQVSRGTLEDVFDRVRSVIEDQLNTYRQDVSKAKLTTPKYDNTFHKQLLEPLHGLISLFALEKLAEQLTKLIPGIGSIPACTGVMRSSMGLPCAHSIHKTINDRMAAGKPVFSALDLQDIGPQWHLDVTDQVGCACNTIPISPLPQIAKAAEVIVGPDQTNIASMSAEQILAAMTPAQRTNIKRKLEECTVKDPTVQERWNKKAKHGKKAKK